MTGAPLLIAWEGMRLEVPVDSTSAGAAYYFGRQDPWEMAFIEAYLRDGDVAVDVGANVGVYTLLMARCVGSKGLVIACEPDPINVRRLQRNLALNQLTNVRVEPVAVGARTERVRFEVGQDSTGRVTLDPSGHEVALTTLNEI